MTQWIFSSETCQCSAGDSDAASLRCALCGLPIQTRIGTLTQWIFKTNTCTCLDNQTEVAPLTTAGLPSDDLIAGSPYHFVGVTGTGGVATVYKAIHQKMSRLVAIKILHADVHDERSAQNFVREAKAASKLQHPNVVTVEDFGVMKDGRQFLVTEWIEGLTLAQYLANKGRLSVEVSRELFSQVLDGLAHAHNRHVVHRDIKPSNLMLSRGTAGGWSVKIIDFGTAKEIECDGSTTRAEDLAVSPFYMSPEHATGEIIDHRSDLYSVGCSLFEVLTGRPPFVGKALSVVMRHQMEAPPTLQAAAGGEEYPQSIEAVVQKLLAKDPANRYQSAVEAKIALNERTTLHLKSAGAETKEATTEKPRSAQSIVIAAVCTVAAMCLMLAVLLLRVSNNVDPVSQPQPLTQTQRSVGFTADPDSWTDMALVVHEMQGGISVSDLPVDNVYSIEFKYIRKSSNRIGLSKLKNARFISLYHQAVTADDIDDLGSLKKLVGLTILDAAVPHGSLRVLHHLPKLEILTLGDCRLNVEDLLSLSGLNLSRLTLSDNEAAGNVASISAICQNKSLSYLNLANCNVDDQAVLKICQLPKLKYLDLEASKLSPQTFAKTSWNALDSLDISYSNATDATIEQLALHADLKTLTATGSKGITDKSVPYLLQMKSLRTLEITGTSITIDGVSKLNHPRLRVIHSVDVNGFGDLWQGEGKIETESK